MKSHTLLIVLCLGAFFIFGGAPASGQKNKTSPWNPSLDSASDKWKLTTRQKMFGDISKLEFGPFSIASIEKLDSPVIKKKIKGTTNVNFKQQFYMTYTDLLFRGLKLNITVAIDFTLSNGIQSEKTSLHYISTESNKYEYIINMAQFM